MAATSLPLTRTQPSRHSRTLFFIDKIYFYYSYSVDLQFLSRLNNA